MEKQRLFHTQAEISWRKNLKQTEKFNAFLMEPDVREIISPRQLPHNTIYISPEGKIDTHTAGPSRSLRLKIRAIEQEREHRRRKKPERSKHYIGKHKDLKKLRRVIHKK
jgi:hypothetical protein